MRERLPADASELDLCWHRSDLDREFPWSPLILTTFFGSIVTIMVFSAFLPPHPAPGESIWSHGATVALTVGMLTVLGADAAICGSFLRRERNRRSGYTSGPELASGAFFSSAKLAEQAIQRAADRGLPASVQEELITLLHDANEACRFLDTENSEEVREGKALFAAVEAAAQKLGEEEWLRGAPDRELQLQARMDSYHTTAERTRYHLNLLTQALTAPHHTTEEIVSGR